MVSTFANCSTTNAFFKYIFLFPKIRNTFPKVKGAVNAKAQGHATIKIAVNTLKAVVTSMKIQYKNEIIANANNAGVKYLLIRSVIDLCCCSTRF